MVRWGLSVITVVWHTVWSSSAHPFIHPKVHPFTIIIQLSCYTNITTTIQFIHQSFIQSFIIHSSMEWGGNTCTYFFRRGDFLLSFSSLGGTTRDVEVDWDTVYDWHTMLHLHLYFQGHTGESSVPGMTSL